MGIARRSLFLSIVPGLIGVLAGPTLGSDLPPTECVQLVRQARIARMSQDPSKALTALRQAAETCPDELVPLVALLDHHRRFDASEEEVARLRALLTERLADPENQVPQGTLEYLVMAPDAAPEDLTLVQGAVGSRLAVAGNDLELLGAMAVLDRRLGRLDALHETLQTMLAIRPTSELHWRCMALDSEFERWDETVGHLEALIAEDPTSVFMRMTLVEAMAKAGRYESLVEQLDLLQSTLDNPPLVVKESLRHLLLTVAWELRDAEREEQAEKMFRRLIDFDPTNAPARQALLYLYSSEEERQAHEAALAQKWNEESDPDALLQEGAGLLAGGDAAGAFDLLQRAAQALPDSEIASFNLGLAAIRLERWEEAERAMGRAAQLNPGRAEAQLNHGIALHYLERCESAVKPLERALELQPDLTQSHYYLYECHKYLGNKEQSDAHRDLYNKAAGQ